MKKKAFNGHKQQTYLRTCHITPKPNSSFHQTGRGVSKISTNLMAVFLTAFSPRPLPHRFLFRPRFSFRAAESLTLNLRASKEKTHQKCRQLSRLS